jgi:hypothetical protein
LKKVARGEKVRNYRKSGKSQKSGNPEKVEIQKKADPEKGDPEKVEIQKHRNAEILKTKKRIKRSTEKEPRIQGV